MNFNKFKKKYLRPVFLLAVFKIIQGILELAGSLILLSLSYSQILKLAVRLTREELLEDPQDILIALLFKHLPLLSDYKQEAGLIVLGVGIYDLVTGIGLLYEKNWARLIILVTLVVSLPYSAYELFLKPDILRMFFLIAQIISIYILWRLKPKKNRF